MRIFYHNARKFRQLHSRLKKANQLLENKGNGKSKLPYELKALLLKIKKLVNRIGFLPKYKAVKLATFGLVFSLAMNVSAQQFLPPTLIDYNLYIPSVENEQSLITHKFMDLDEDGDNECIFELQYSGGNNFIRTLSFQENISDGILRFDSAIPLYLDNNQFSVATMQLQDLDQDGDYDLYAMQNDYYLSRTFFIVYENISNEAKVFDFVAPIIEPNISVVNNFVCMQFVDLDNDSDKDLLISAHDNMMPYNVTDTEFYYYENNGNHDNLIPFNDVVLNPFNLDNVLITIQTDNFFHLSFMNYFDLQDIDNDGDKDLIVEGTTYDEYYNKKHYQLNFYPNESSELANFQNTKINLIEIDANQNPENPSDTSISNFQFDFSIHDIDNDGDLDATLISSSSTGIIAYERETELYLLENVGTGTTLIEGFVFLDSNSNNQQDANESGLSNHVIKIEPYNIYITNSDGSFTTFLGESDFTITTQAPPAWNVVPEQYDITTGNNDTISNLDFAIQPIANQQDLRIDAIGSTTRRGFDTHYTLKLRNLGTTIEDAEIVATFDEDLDYLSSDLTPFLVNGNTITWTIDDFAPFQTKNIEIDAYVSLNSALNDTLCSVFSITPEINDIEPQNNTDTLKQIVIGSFDPNDKLVQPLGVEEDGAVHPTTDLFSYTIRFQNTGTDTAFTVFVVDTIDADLDLNTFEMVGASHDYTFEVNEERQAIWTFNNILLPDSAIDQTGSNGYIQYDIIPVENSPEGTQFTNSADIYFDFNDPVKTNTTINTFRVILGLHQKELLTFELFPNPTAQKAILQFENPNREKAFLELYDLNGKLVLQDEVYSNQVTLNRNQLANGIYTFSLKVGNEVGAGKIVFK